MKDDVELLREWRVGDKCRVMGVIGRIILIEGDRFHVRQDDCTFSDIEFPYRTFSGNELEPL